MRPAEMAESFARLEAVRILARLLARVYLLGACAVVAMRPAQAQDTTAVVVLPEAHVFRPLRADPKQPAFFAAYLFMKSVERTTDIANVGLGEDIGLVGDRGGRWDLGIAAGVFAQFDMDTPSYDLLNTDFVVGIPFGWRVGRFGLRARVYHQSSHLGDEYLLSSGATRVNYSYLSLELLASRDFGPLRVYAGAEDLFERTPKALRPAVVHWGAEWGRRGRRLGSLGQGAPFVALDAKASQERKWRIGWDARLGYDFATRSGSGRHWSVELRGYDGPSPYGQFYETDVRAVGAAIGFAL